MWTLVKRLWTDEDAAVRFGRGMLLAAGGAMQTGLIPAGKLGWYAAPLLQMIALAYGAKPSGGAA